MQRFLLTAVALMVTTSAMATTAKPMPMKTTVTKVQTTMPADDNMPENMMIHHEDMMMHHHHHLAPYVSLNIGYGGMFTPELGAQDFSGAFSNPSNPTFKNEERFGLYGRVATGLEFASWGNSRFGIEIGDANYKNTKSSIGDTEFDGTITQNIKYDGTTIDLLATATVDIDTENALFFKTGVAYVSESANINTLIVDTSGDEPETFGGQYSVSGHAFRPEFVLGYAYKFSPKAAMTLGYSYIPGPSKTTQVNSLFTSDDSNGVVHPAAVHSLTLGVNYIF